jgi:prophage tail gpP-like protein
MADFILKTFDGKSVTLPQPLAWRLEYGLGSPCDSFWVKILWAGGGEDTLAAGYRMTVTHEGKTVFTGVVDECLCRWSDQGCTAEITGRGMQALLLDNQAEAADFGKATLSDILRRYVTPYGIALEKWVELPAVWGFSVTSGSSCWKVLYQFARYYGGVTPRFDRLGRLVLRKWEDGSPLTVSQADPVTGLRLRERRYGVLSRVTVKDVSGWSRNTAVNRDFEARGGRAERVILVPKDTGYQARRYDAQFQLDRSRAGARLIEVTMPRPFAAWPGDLVRLNRPDWKRNGTYRVQESKVTLGERGMETTLVLGDVNAVI